MYTWQWPLASALIDRTRRTHDAIMASDDEDWGFGLIFSGILIAVWSGLISLIGLVLWHHPGTHTLQYISPTGPRFGFWLCVGGMAVMVAPLTVAAIWWTTVKMFGWVPSLPGHLWRGAPRAVKWLVPHRTLVPRDTDLRQLPK